MQVDKFGNTPLHYCSTEVSMNAAEELLLFGPKQQLYVTNNNAYYSAARRPLQPFDVSHAVSRT